MKRTLFSILAIVITASSLVSCGGGNKSGAQGEVYQCPMKCSDQKSDKPAKCEVCGMDLEKVAEG